MEKMRVVMSTGERVVVHVVQLVLANKVSNRLKGGGQFGVRSPHLGTRIQSGSKQLRLCL